MKNFFGYAGLVLTVTGVAVSTVPSCVKWCFPVLFAAAVAWLVNGWLARNRPQVITQLVLLILNGVAVYRWFL